jgi:hypothetical protein
MKEFKFLTIKKPVFRFEIMVRINYTPAILMVREHWTLVYSNLVKEWLSDICFKEQLEGWPRIKYFHEIDRTGEIIQLGLDSTSYGERIFTAIIKIKKSEYEYMEVHLNYPIDNPIYITDENI